MPKRRWLQERCPIWSGAGCWTGIWSRVARACPPNGRQSRARQGLWRVTQEEAADFTPDLRAPISRYRDRAEDPDARPPQSIPLEVLVFTYPLDAVHSPAC